MRKIITSIAAITLFALPSETFAVPLVQNGSFETGTAPGTFLTLTALNTTDIANWSVDAGTVDYIGSYWTASDGSRSLDMNGTSAGTVSQTFATNVGATYQVTFDLSGNPDGAPAVKVLRVTATGATPQDFSYDTGAQANTKTDMKWAHETYTFTATAGSTQLSFASQIAGAFGPALDNVAVTQTASTSPPANACDTPTVVPTGFTIQKATVGVFTYTLTPSTMFVGKSGNFQLTGPAGNYIVCVSNGNNTVNLGNGNDTVVTGNGNQRITVGAGNGTIKVGNGNSTVLTGTGSWNISAGNGNSTLTGGGASSTCHVGRGISTITNCAH